LLHRPAVDERTLELPSEHVDPGPAARELREETAARGQVILRQRDDGNVVGRLQYVAELGESANRFSAGVN
jgi:hypothetical protein